MKGESDNIGQGYMLEVHVKRFLGNIYFLDWTENPKEWKSWDSKFGLGVGVNCLLPLEWE